MRHPRTAIAGMALSAAALVALMTEEGYTSKAIIPVKGDIPTLGFGMTERPDGSKVQMGDTINPVQAVQRTLAYTQRVDSRIKRCVTAPLSQVEYNLMHNFSYQYGVGALCSSSMVRLANAGDYAGSCNAYLAYRYVGKFDCSTPGNRVCSGVWARSKDRHDQCMAAQ